MKARVRLNDGQQKAMKKEINRQLSEQTKEHESDIDAILMWFMHEEYGWGKKRLNDFITKFNTRLKELSDWYAMDETDQLWLIKYKLREMGINYEKMGE